jgi:NitT/TauT family transport system substrate-binding protein
MVRRIALIVRSLVVLVVLCAQPLQVHADPLIIGVAGPGINMVYAFLTKDLGFWQKYGIDARVVLFDAGSILAQAAISGDVKLSITSGPTTVASRTQGADTIIICATVNTLPYSIVAAKGITTWDQLKGKRVAISRLGSGTDTAVRMVLKKYGLDPNKDVIIVQLGTQPARMLALNGGVIDATIVSPPLDIAAKKQGFQILVNIADLGIPYPQQVLETTERFNRENPQLVKNLVKGFIDGVRYAATHKDETKKIITKYLKTADPEVLEATYQSYLQVTDYTANPNLAGIRNAMDEVAVRMPVVKNKKPEEFVDPRFLKELEKEGYFKTPPQIIAK